MRTILFGLIASIALIGQDSRNDFSISGTVVNSVTGEPVKGAVVVLTGFLASDPAVGTRPAPVVPFNRVTSTGTAGEYLFTGLSARQYIVRAQKPGFADDANESGARRRGIRQDMLNVSASIANHTIRLDPLGVIEGGVVNQYGDPLGRVTVNLFEYYFEDGVRRVRQVRTAVTDDRGQFRLWDLQPGKYYVKAMGRAGGTFMYVGDGSARYDSWEGFRPVYFGGAREMESATPVTVTSGTQARADFTLAVERTYKVRGTLENFIPHLSTTFELFESDSNAAARRVSLNARTGKFEIDDVPSGQYTLRVTQVRRTRGEAILTVKGGDVSGVSIPLAPGVTVTGTVRVIGEAGEKPRNPSAGSPGENDLTDEAPCYVNLAGATSAEDYVESNRSAGEFSIEAVLPGRYRVRVQCSNGYVASSLSGSSDLLANPEITVQPGIPPLPIEIGFKHGGGGVHVKVVSHDASPGTGVLLAPAFAGSAVPVWGGAVYPNGQDGLASWVSNLAPGDYLAYALSDIESLEYRNPEFLNALTGGTNVHIEEGKTTEITLTSVVK